MSFLSKIFGQGEDNSDACGSDAICGEVSGTSLLENIGVWRCPQSLKISRLGVSRLACTHAFPPSTGHSGGSEEGAPGGGEALCRSPPPSREEGGGRRSEA